MVNRDSLLLPYDRNALVTDTDEIAVVNPHLLQDLHSRHRLGTNEWEDSAKGHLVISERAFGSYGGP